ncbi:hypothetical protein NF27_DP01130 [Candidatus Jidaibacter acanthamoeba]|uniref:Uncharacterized protein n=1 Tax=Candidatus Jidaibacter acanthamoebae TaxID=86105 RepID=A0A0C1QJ83_9RICK|nr:hypothetical protein [Candidatus Jidaibacter acanthamoeba]KIE05569.1 hypothetical protein NF27_DP01130 [Candidatus Jidaibacter acanthamoeba]
MGQRHKTTQAEVLTQDIEKFTVIADKGYDGNAFLSTFEIK